MTINKNLYSADINRAIFISYFHYTVLTDVKGYHFLADVRKLKANTVRKSEKK